MDSYNIQLSAENDESEIFLDVTENGENIEITTEDYTPVGVTSVNGKKGRVVLTTSDIENTSDYQSKSQVDANIADKVDKHNNSNSAHPYIQSRVDSVQTQVNRKQDTLVSGTNIKTINNQSVLGSGNLEIQGGAEYGFTGIITGTSANPTDGVTLANGTYLADPSKATSYINLAMEDGTTRRQSAPKGSVIIRTAGRLIVLGTQNLMYSYNTSLHYFYEPESFVEAYVRVIATDEYADIGTLSSPNNKVVIGDIYSLEGVINTGETSHARVIFKVVDDLQGEPFEYNITASDDEPILYENGVVPEFKQGVTYILEFYGHNCEIFGFSDTPVADVVNYNDLSNKPVISHKTTSIASRTVTVGTTNTTIQGTQAIDTLAGFQFIPLDMSEYTSGAANKALLPETHLPAGVYIVTAPGYMRLGSDTKLLDVGAIIYWRGIEAGGELDLMGYNACEYYGYDSQNDEWSGGFFTTEDDVNYIIAEKMGWTINNSTVSGGTATMTDGRWSRRTRAAGITSLTISFPSEIPEYNYKSKLTCRTSSTFSAFNITARDYDIYFYGDDCVNGVLTGVAGKYYEMEANHDGFDGLIVKVHSHPLSSS